jgi:hypothetical protein
MIQIIAFTLFLFVSFSSFSQVVTKQEAQLAAFHFIQQLNPEYKGLNEPELFQTAFTKLNEPAWYLFTTPSNGFIILSAEKAAFPILAFSADASFTNEKASFPPSFIYWMDQRTAEIEEIRREQFQSDEQTDILWEALITGTNSFAHFKTRSISPLLKSAWNQDCRYNEMCPVDAAGPCGRVYAGCVATAMGQIMYYWRFPQTGNGTTTYSAPPYGTQYVNFGSTTYHWDQMQGSIYSSHPELAKMLYHAGVSVKMNYSPSGSGASSSDVPSALKNKFRYATANYRSKSNYLTTNWNNLLISNLDLQRPVYYSGSGSGGGHAWVCDGYQGSDHFHFDWGWSGAYNGYYYLSNLNPGSNTFNSWQAAIVDILPPAALYPQYCNGQKILSAISGSFDDGSGPVAEYQSNVNCSWLIKPSVPVDWIRLNFVYFDTQADYDIVTIYDGETTSSPVLGTYSGSTLPTLIQGTNQAMLVTFSTDNSIQTNGFLAEYYANPSKFCSGTVYLNDLSGIIEDGSGPDFLYANSTNCRWTLDVPGAQKFYVHFLEFKTEPTMDKLRILDLVNNSLIAEFSGAQIPSPLEITASRIQFHFITNATVQDNGWKLSYSVSTETDEIQQQSISIFPNPASETLTVIIPGFSGKSDISVFDLSGKLCHFTHVSAGNENITIDISQLIKGMYFVVVTTDQRIYRSKLFKQ